MFHLRPPGVVRHSLGSMGRARTFEQMFSHLTGIGPVFSQLGFFKRQAPEQILLTIARFQAQAERASPVLDGVRSRCIDMRRVVNDVLIIPMEVRMKRTPVLAAIALSLYSMGPAMADSMLGDPQGFVTRHVWAVESGSRQPYLSSLYEAPDQNPPIAQPPQTDASSVAPINQSKAQLPAGATDGTHQPPKQ